jgi:hypothetical protein
MRKLEIIYLLLALVSFLVLGFYPRLELDERLGIRVLVIWSVGLMYLIGGYWLFRKNDKSNKVLAIISGIIFLSSLFVLPYLLNSLRTDIILYFLLPNFIFSAILLVFTAINVTKKKIFKGVIFGVFLRSVIISLISSILYFTPMSNILFGKVMMFINHGNSELFYQFKTAEYNSKYAKAFDGGDCKSALEYAVKAHNYDMLSHDFDTTEHLLQVTVGAGRSIDLSKSTSDSIVKLIAPFLVSGPDDYKPIGTPVSGTYKELFYAYRCMAEREYKADRYSTAMLYYYYADYNGRYAKFDSSEFAECHKKLLGQMKECLAKYNR